MSNTAQEAEAELEAFRRRWRDEVSARSKGPAPPSSSSRLQSDGPEQRTAVPSVPSTAGPSTAPRKQATDFSEEVEPKAYHDLPDKEEQLKLGTVGQNHDRALIKEPSSALEHYERAVEKETQGQLGDSMKHYRKAFKVGWFPVVRNL